MGSLDFPSLSFGDFALPSFDLPPLTARAASEEGTESGGEEEDPPRESIDGSSWTEQSTSGETETTEATELSKEQEAKPEHVTLPLTTQRDTAPPPGEQPTLSRRFSYERGSESELSVVAGADEDVPNEVTGTNSNDNAELPWVETPQEDDDPELQRAIELSRQTIIEDDRRRSQYTRRVVHQPHPPQAPAESGSQYGANIYRAQSVSPMVSDEYPVGDTGPPHPPARRAPSVSPMVSDDYTTAYTNPNYPSVSRVSPLTSVEYSYNNPRASAVSTVSPLPSVQSIGRTGSAANRHESIRQNASTARSSSPHARDNSTRSPRSRPLSNAYRPTRIPLSSSPNRMDGGMRSPQLIIPDESRRPRASSYTSARMQIRDSSRARSTTSGATSGELCDDCQRVGPRRYYCNVCMHVFCDACWDKQLVHRSNHLAVGPGTLPHEKTDQSVARKVRDVLTPNLKDEEREQLHIADIDTTWFGVVREGHERPLFRDYGRYANLIAGAKDLRIESATALSATSDNSETLYPSLVSFVGQTGAGKSTLIKLLIDLKSEEDERFPTPVVGAVGRDVATSEDVHLYLDPDSSESQAPLLFADCEGLEGGERDPIGAKLKRKMESAQPIGPGGRRKPRLKHTSERELIWADTPKKQSREFAVAHLYPRLLYTFSDVICFVLRNPRVIESVLERLVDWAAAALETSSNQPVLPHAILVLNATENDIPEDLWDVDNATESLMESLSRTVYQNATFKRYAQFWRTRDRSIESVQDLILSYYSSLRVVRIPTTGRPKLIREQVEKLSDGIRWASKESRERKLELRMLLDADDFAPYLSNAFDHFAENLNTPFDFVQASFINSPIPNDFGGNILKLALQVMECWVDVAKAAPIFEELSYLVASSILLDAARHKIRGTAEQIFPQYLEHLDNALENFCDRHWPCEYHDPKRQGGRCVNVRSGHGAKGHQSKSGKLLAAGDYVSDFSFRDYQRVFQEETYRMLVRLRERVRDKERDGNMSEEQAAAEVHKEMVLPYFFQHASRDNVRSFVSHTICYSCLFESPEHALPCGHVICTTCLRTYGKSHLNRYVEIPECPIEKRERRFRSAWKVTLKPASCGVRVLTLDGGGVRGIVELEILKQLERELGGRVNVTSFFDLIVGTSTGGIIALGLTARNWTVEECTQHFEALCAKAFTLRKGMNMPGVGWLVSNYNHSMYETQPLQEALIEAFTEDQYLFGGQRSDSGTTNVKVAVTATSAAGSAVVLSNYNRFCSEKLSYMFHRPEKRHGELKTWEAARATSAAPKYFKPLCHETSKQIFSDGGIYHNNPIQIAERERRLIWPTLDDQGPDVIVSVGTLFCRKIKEKKSMRWTASPRGIVAHGRFLTKLANDHLHTSLDSEKTWHEFLNVRAPRGKEKDRYVRINPEIEEHPPKLDDVAQMKKLQERTRLLVGDDPRIKALARRLVATSFYMDIVGDVREDVQGDLYEVTGWMHCRFIVGHEVMELGKFIKAAATAGHPAHFLVSEVEDGIHLPQEILFDSKVINRMIQHQVFRMDPVTIRRSTKYAKTDISLCYTKGTTYPISGFPRLLHADKPVVTGLVGRHALTVANSVRWASRSRSQQQRRFDWTPPDVSPPLGMQDVIERYANPMHLLGSVTDENLLMMKSRNGIAGVAGYEPYLHNTHADPHTTAGATAHSELEGTSTVSELPASPAEQRREDLPRLVVELPATEAPEIPKYWMADDDWSEARMPQPRAVGSIYMSLSCGDVLEVRKMPADGTWLVYRPSDQREGWVPSSCLRPLPNHRDFAPRSPYSNSPVDGRPW